MAIIPICAFTDNYIWAIIDEKAGIFDCVDPGDANPVLQFAKTQNLQLRAILITHHHQDHIGGVAELLRTFPSCIVYGPDDPRIPEVNHLVKENQVIKIGHYTFKILSNPGHTSSHISYYEPDEHWLFCGDTLFSAGCGRVFDGTLTQLHQSMQLFKSLPVSTKVFCAHEYTLQNLRFAHAVEPNNSFITEHMQKIKEQSCTLPSTLNLELLINPFLRTESTEIKQFTKNHGALSDDSLEVFRVLREQKNSFK